mmetsp:Transcript_12604/g.32377  ORF Transcript_12604/g.32377 Transcript_12604/m.32377 type:complete len:225 (+) Transcript_12604:848-1522(+)
MVVTIAGHGAVAAGARGDEADAEKVAGAVRDVQLLSVRSRPAMLAPADDLVPRQARVDVGPPLLGERGVRLEGESLALGRGRGRRVHAKVALHLHLRPHDIDGFVGRRPHVGVHHVDDGSKHPVMCRRGDTLRHEARDEPALHIFLEPARHAQVLADLDAVPVERHVHGAGEEGRDEYAADDGSRQGCSKVGLKRIPLGRLDRARLGRRPHASLDRRAGCSGLA